MEHLKMKKLLYLVLFLLITNLAIVAQGTYTYNVQTVECFNSKTNELVDVNYSPNLIITFKLNSQSTGRMIFSTDLVIYLNSYKRLYEGAFEYKSVKADNNSKCITQLYFSEGGVIIILIFNDLTFRYTAWVN